MWIELIPGWTFPEEREDFPPSMIRCEMPLTAADGILLLVGAQCHLEDEAANVGKSGQLTRRDIEELGELMSVSGECQSAMYRIRRDQLDAYLAPRPRA